MKYIHFLFWLHENYGNVINATLQQIADKNGTMNLCTVRNNLLYLKKEGLVQFEEISKRRVIYHINAEKYELVEKLMRK